MKPFFIKRLLSLGAILIAVALFVTPTEEKRQPPQSPSLVKAWGRFPIDFVENQGQVDRRVDYTVQGKDKTLYFGPEGVTFSITTPTLTLPPQGGGSKDGRGEIYPPSLEGRGSGGGWPVREAAASVQRWNVKLDFVGANPDVRPEGREKTGTVFSYFKGPKKDWKTGIPTYRQVAYRDLWPGIDLIYSGTMDLLKQDFVVKPGSDPGVIKLAWVGPESVTVTDDGGMEIKTPLGGFRDERPVAYQMIGGEKVAVEVAYDLKQQGDRYRYGFRLGAYDRTQELVIDPLTFIYAGFIGGSGADVGRGIAVDGSGNAYVTGYTASTEATFPETVGPDLTHNGGTNDVFVAKVNSAGTALVYAGFIGGSGSDAGYSIAVDGSGNAYVTGETASTETTFPETVGPDLTSNGGGDAFVAKVASDGTALVYAGYIGGSGSDVGNSIAVDVNGNAYVTGQTASTEATFPETVGPDLTQNGSWDAFVAKIASDGTALTYAGFIGGNTADMGRGIAVDGSGNAYVGGETASTETTFPETVGPDLTQNGGQDAFVAKVASDGAALTYAGFIGGSGADLSYSIAADGSGNAYVMGYTNSTETTFPETVGPDLTQNGSYDAFVAKVASDGTALTYAGFIGGSGVETGYGIAVDGSGNAYVTGYTNSTETTFPETAGPDLTQNGSYDAFVAKVASDGTALTYAGFVGGSGADQGYSIAVDGSGNAYVMGEAPSTEATFPDGDGFGSVTGPDLTQNGGSDAFVAKVGTVATCGDGVVEGSEACDDGNSSNTDACLTTCVAASCGDGYVRAGTEACDDGNASNTDACLTTCVAASCGDGYVRAGTEACDDGNSSNTDACLNTCVAASCGDTYTQAGVEACDDGNSSNTDACLTTCAAASCGDGYVRAGTEACDDGNAVNTDACLTTCVAASCGDGYVRAGTEACDDANADNTDACLTTCVAASCGDGYVRAGTEACDDGNAVNTDACLTTCVAASCGDGYARAGTEACDDANAANTDACLTTCVAASCGDGFVRAGTEACDDGNAVNTDACLTTCVAASCGDGFVRAGTEACDDGNAANTDACLTTCVAASCGDGYARAGTEACDDGNAVNTDACLTTCVAASCGDGFVRAGTEACDDGNSSTTDACLNNCVAAICGDGYVRAGTEACDDGNSLNTDTCLTTCVLHTCGDGHVQSGEECDNGGTNSDTVADACRTACLNPSCGDSAIDDGEACDDGNADDGDGCDAACQEEDDECTPEVSMDITHPDSGPIQIGSNTTFVVSVSNLTDCEVTNAVLGFGLSDNMDFVSATAEGEGVATLSLPKRATTSLSCTGTQSVDCNLAVIGANETVDTSVVTLVKRPGSLSLSARVMIVVAEDEGRSGAGGGGGTTTTTSSAVEVTEGGEVHILSGVNYAFGCSLNPLAIKK